MNRRAFLKLAALVGAMPAIARAQAKTYRIGIMLATSRSIPATARAVDSLVRGLRDLGYIEGKNIAFEWREAEGRVERTPALVADLVAHKVDLIWTGGDAQAIEAMKATRTIPVVFVGISDPVGLGLARSLAMPGKNLTGLASFTQAIIAKQLELLREVFPRIRRIAVINSPGDPINPSQLVGMRAASAALKMEHRLYDLNAEEQLDGIFRAIAREQPEGMQVFITAVSWFLQKRIVEFAAKQRLPSVYGNIAYVEAGGLMAYSFSYEDLYRRGAIYVDKILRGAKPGDLPIEQPTKLDLAVNLKAARALGVKIPQPVISRADRVIG